MSVQICPKCGQRQMTWSMDEEVSKFTLWWCNSCRYAAEEDETKIANCPACNAERGLSILKGRDGFHQWCYRCGLFATTDQTF